MISGRDPDEVSFSLGFNLVTTLPKAADEISSLKIAIRPRLLRVVAGAMLCYLCLYGLRAIITALRAALRVVRRK